MISKVSSVAALFALFVVAAAGPFTDAQSRIQNAKSDAEVIRIIRSSGALKQQTDIKQDLTDLDGKEVDEATAANTARNLVQLGALGETPVQAKESVSSNAKEIKSSRLYADPGIDVRRNAFADAIERLKNIKFDHPNSNINAPDLGFLSFLVTYMVWFLLGAAVLTLLYFAVRHINWQKALTRKSNALLTEDEPDRTLDEWLVLADEHAANGRFREAVRALYLACLMRFDENDVARFIRGETNWEHLSRIQVSPNLPEGLDFRPPTMRFDRIWYGKQTQGMSDVEAFRGWYQDITAALRSAKA